MKRISIRIATHADLPTIVSFNAAMALETEDIVLDQTILTKGVEAVLSNESLGFYIVCEIAGSVQACLMITYEWSDWRNGMFWWIQSVYVETEFRSQGLFSKMFKHIEHLLIEKKNIAGLRLYVEKNNYSAKTVYEKRGMTKTKYSLYEKGIS